jgi:hypothetical protein
VDCCDVNADAPSSNDRFTQRRSSGAPHWKRASAALAAVGIALLPKCPACWSIYAGLSSWLGVSFVIPVALLRPLTLASLALAVLALASVARERRALVPALVGVAAASGVWLGKFELGSDLLTYSSVLTLLCCSLLARRAGRRRPRAVADSQPSAARSELTEHAHAR